MVFRRKPTEERAQREAEKEQRKAEKQERREAAAVAFKEKRQEQALRRVEEAQERLRADLSPDETELGCFKTAKAIMKKYVLFTSKRLLVASTSNTANPESIPYRSIAGFSTSDFVTKDIHVTVHGRRDKLSLLFRTAEERSQALAILNERAL